MTPTLLASAFVVSGSVALVLTVRGLYEGWTRYQVQAECPELAAQIRALGDCVEGHVVGREYPPGVVSIARAAREQWSKGA